MRIALLLLLVACGSDPATTVDAAIDAAADADDGKAANCASTFGTALTDAFGRLDGTVRAIVPPAHPTCAQPNSSHVVVQIDMNGAAYRMVVNVMSRSSDPRIFTHAHDGALVGPAWSEGWHTGVMLDYTVLGVQSTAFVPRDMADAVAMIDDAIPIGERISVFATSSGGTKADSAHLVHRNAPGADGAIVVGSDTAMPRYLLFRFADQSF